VNLLDLPWLEISVALCLSGALCVSQQRDPTRASRWGLAFTGTILGCTIMAWLAFVLPPDPGADLSVQPYLFGKKYLALDQLSAPLVPIVALLHFLTALATARTKMRRFSFAWSLAAEAVRQATFSCTDRAGLIALLIISTVPPYIELLNRGKPTRVYLVHMSLYVVLLLVGFALLEFGGSGATTWAAIPLAAAVLICCGAVPVHCWITDWFENASFGIALLFVTPLVGFYAAIRLVFPIAPDWVLQAIGVISLFTAVYAAAMATVQREMRRLFAYLFLSHGSLVMIGLELHTSISFTGALCLWFSVILSIGGLGLTMRALEARFGRLSLGDFHGLYEHVPMLAICFLITGLASVGFPGTIGFVSTELIVDGAVQTHLIIGLAVVATAGLNGIAVVRAYFLLFTGKQHVSAVSLQSGWRERVALLTLSALVLVGGWFPQPGIESRNHAADALLTQRTAEFVNRDLVDPGNGAGVDRD
jgi:NADH-quinone oxidoreductase subunit M